MCAVCKIPERLLTYGNHNCPKLPYGQRHIAWPISIHPQTEVAEWSGKIGGKFRLEYIQEMHGPTVNFLSAVSTPEVVRILQSYKQQFAQHQIDAGDLRLIMFFNN